MHLRPFCEKYSIDFNWLGKKIRNGEHSDIVKIERFGKSINYILDEHEMLDRLGVKALDRSNGGSGKDLFEVLQNIDKEIGKNQTITKNVFNRLKDISEEDLTKLKIIYQVLTSQRKNFEFDKRMVEMQKISNFLHELTIVIIKESCELVNDAIMAHKKNKKVQVDQFKKQIFESHNRFKKEIAKFISNLHSFD